MQISKIINKKYLEIDYKKVSSEYKNQYPFPHIFLPSFFKNEFIKDIAKDFPDLKKTHSYEKKKYK